MLADPTAGRDDAAMYEDESRAECVGAEQRREVH
jgi:hypothetical protein